MASPLPSEREAAAHAAPGDLEGLRIDRGRRARKRRLVPLLVAGGVVVVVLGAVWAAMGEELLAPRVHTVRVLRIAATDGVVRTSASGYVAARRKAAISSRLSGRLEMLTVDEGDDVKEGQLLGQLGHADLDAAVSAAKAQVEVDAARVETAKKDAATADAAAEVARARLAQHEAHVRENESRLVDAEKSLARQGELKVGVTTTQESLDRVTMEREVAARQLEQMRAQLATAVVEAKQAALAADADHTRVTSAEAGLALARASLEQAQAIRADANIVAPFAGRVLRKEAEIGEMVAPVNAAGSTTRGAIVTLADFSTLEMEVDVIERDIRLVEPGGPCRIVLDSVRDHPYAGTVRQIVPTADKTKSTVQVKVSFLKLDGNVSPEMSGRVEFLKPGAQDKALGSDRVLAPKAAIVERDGKRVVFEVKERRAARREVTLVAGAAEKDGLVEVASGVTGGEDLIVDPPARLADGELVRVETPAK